MTDNPKVTALARADGFCSALGSHGKFAADSPRQIRDWISVLEQSIRRAEDSARAEGYEAARKDLAALHGAKWAKEDYEKGWAEAIEIGMKRQSAETSESVLRKEFEKGRAKALEEVRRFIDEKLSHKS